MTRRIRIGLRVFSNPGWRGGINYVVNWAAALSLLPANERPVVALLYFDEAGRKIAVELQDIVDLVRPWADASALDLDLVYPATHVLEAPTGTPWAGWIPDWQHRDLPEMFEGRELARRRLHYCFMVENAPVVVASSDHGLSDMARACGSETAPRRRLRFPAVLRDTPSPADIAQVREKLGLPEKYLIVCNQWWKHKNNEAVVAALARTFEPVTVVFTGATSDERWPDYFDSVMRVATESGVEQRIRVLGAVPRQQQIAALAGAHAVVQPSLFEGWSTLVEEARSMRKLLVLSDIPVHREQAPDWAVLFPPHDVAALSAALEATWAREAMHPDAAHALEHKAYIMECAREFLSLARTACKRWNADQHDPAVLLPRLLAGCSVIAEEHREALRESILGAAHATIKTSPAALARAMNAAEASKNEAVFAAMEGNLEAPLLESWPAKMSAQYRRHRRVFIMKGFWRKLWTMWR